MRAVLLVLALAGACSQGEAPPQPLPPLVLDEGRPWRLDEHARSNFASARRAAGAEPTDDAARRALGAELQELVRVLIEGCTMSGPAHDQLHQFLGMYVPAVDRLAASGSSADAAAVRELLELHARSFE